MVRGILSTRESLRTPRSPRTAAEFAEKILVALDCLGALAAQLV